MGTVTVISATLPDPAFWRGRRVLVTGHTGFKGSWLCSWLDLLGAEIAGVALPGAPSEPSLWDQLALDIVDDIRADIAGEAWQERAMAFGPEVVVHLAAQPLVSEGWRAPLQTFATNVMGTAQVMQLLPRFSALRATLVVTTDKVYDALRPPPYAETAPLGGHDPYSASKAATELLVRSWPTTGGPVATARAGNVIGGGDWAPDRLIPDLVRAWSAGSPAVLRRPEAVRPWQHVMEPLCGYLVHVERLASGEPVDPALNFGPAGAQRVRVIDVAQHAAAVWARFHGTTPALDLLAEPTMAETEELVIDSTRAAAGLGWTSQLDWEKAITLTMEWYSRHHDGEAPADLVREQLHAFEKATT